MKKRHHTVPKSYLEEFTDKDGFVWVLDRENRIFNTNPINILVQKKFYTVTLKNGEKSLVVEDALADIEGEYIKIFNEKIKQKQILGEEERAKMAIFIAALLFRTGPVRKHLQSEYGKIQSWASKWEAELRSNSGLRDALSASPASGETISLEELDETLKNFDEFHSLSVLENLPSTAQLIFDMKWCVMEAQGDGFLTCDDPVSLLRPESILKYGINTIGSTPGLIYDDTELTLPLSKGYALLAGWKLERDSYLPCNEDLVKQINQRTMMRASEVIIGASKSELDVIIDGDKKASQ